MDEVADVHDDKQRHGRLIEQDDQLPDTVVVQDLAAGIERNDCDQHERDPEKRYPAPASGP